MSIDHQPATTPDVGRARSRVGPPGERVLVVRPPRVWTLAKIAALVGATAVAVALATAVIAGSALFTVLNH